jgi:CheY-like chemotaxis protein
MEKEGPIIIIEDDQDDQNLIGEIFKRLKYQNEVIFFNDGNLALDYLKQSDVQPFIILSDVNMPKINGFELRGKIRADENLNAKCIPYIFFTSAANGKVVNDAYEMSVQGFFLKPNKFKELESTIRSIVEYWKVCLAPSRYE